ncbi:MAG: hypothetical protein V4616_15230 [Bacteroidota bacterium]
MKIEFLRDIKGRGEHVMRIYDFDKSQAQLFRDDIREVITEGRTVHLSDKEYITCVNCFFSLRISGQDVGILTDDDHHFFLKMSIAGYEDILQKIEPFCQRDAKTYIWLYDLDNPVELLFSAGEFVLHPDDVDED